MRFLVTILPALSLMFSGLAFGQSYPDKPIKIYQGFAAGGNADTIARLVSGEISKGIKQAFIVEAQTGAGGTIAAGTVARASPDGYTLLLATGGHAVAAALYQKISYKTIADFQPISTITYFPFLIVTTADSKYKTLIDVLKDAKQNPGLISYGSAGIGSTHHLAGELLAKMAGVEMTHVPYRGDSASLTALLSGEVPIIIAPPTAVNANIRAGKLRVLATTGPNRWPSQPNIPTVSEQGIKGYEVRSWAGLLAPINTPKAVVQLLNKEILKAIQVPQVKERLEEMGGEVRGSTPEEFNKLIKSDVDKWNFLIKSTNIPQQ